MTRRQIETIQLVLRLNRLSTGFAGKKPLLMSMFSWGSLYYCERIRIPLSGTITSQNRSKSGIEYVWRPWDENRELMFLRFIEVMETYDPWRRIGEIRTRLYQIREEKLWSRLSIPVSSHLKT
jgi:hypothetical protein